MCFVLPEVDQHRFYIVSISTAVTVTVMTIAVIRTVINTAAFCIIVVIILMSRCLSETIDDLPRWHSFLRAHIKRFAGLLLS